MKRAIKETIEKNKEVLIFTACFYGFIAIAVIIRIFR